MGVGRVTRTGLARFVAGCDDRGGPQHPDCVAFLSDFSYVVATPVNQGLDPFSDACVAEQVAVYRELSGRDLDQAVFEQADVDVAGRVDAANPWGSNDPGFVAPHALAVLQAVWLARLGPGARVLDMGCGAGISTELMAFCGAQVTSVDINPRSLALVAARALKRGLSVRTVLSAFEDLDLGDERHDLALFYESLHHAVRPWTAIERVVRHLAPGGKVIISGEPIQSTWWENWGLRLDATSVYCIHKHGWFESGWSKTFLKACFARSGLRLHLLRGLSLGTGSIGIAARDGDDDWAWEARAVAASTLALQVARGIRRELKTPAGLLQRVRQRLR